ncbi:TlpA family protein disulfide reductase [Nocardioides sp. NPDC057772]|uniref:TlpA family protein disulfide reductase n=1 Tax=Nocardioides sp. NPDC057772 TaxID=3346245 RepID=UPI0002028B45|nr:thiol:disulfide interchange protein, thioredoxin family [Nocardioidaceae bacterium Broad-1]
MSQTETPAPTTPARGRRILIAIAVAGAIALVAWVVADRSEEAPRASAEGGSVVEEFDIADRAAGKPFQAQLLSGKQLDSDTLKGKVVVYNVWGSWCAPCVAEAPDLVKVANEFTGQVTFMGINVRDNDGAARAFERKHLVPYDSITSAGSIQAMGAFHNSLAASAAPTTLVVDREGRVAARAIGPVTATTLRNLIEPVLAEDNASR